MHVSDSLRTEQFWHGCSLSHLNLESSQLESIFCKLGLWLSDFLLRQGAHDSGVRCFLLALWCWVFDGEDAAELPFEGCMLRC